MAWLPFPKKYFVVSFICSGISLSYFSNNQVSNKIWMGIHKIHIKVQNEYLCCRCIFYCEGWSKNLFGCLLLIKSISPCCRKLSILRPFNQSKVINFVDLKANSARLSNEGHNLFKVFYPQNMSNIICILENSSRREPTPDSSPPRRRVIGEYRLFFEYWSPVELFAEVWCNALIATPQPMVKGG